MSAISRRAVQTRSYRYNNVALQRVCVGRNGCVFREHNIRRPKPHLYRGRGVRSDFPIKYIRSASC